MADLTSLSQLGDGSALTEAQIQAIINQIDLNIVNLMRDGKLGAARHQQYGAEGGEVDRSGAMREMMKARAIYEQMLHNIPSEIQSQYDDPSF